MNWVRPPGDWLVVFSLVVILHLFTSLLLPRVARGFFGTYLIPPAAWAMLTYLICRLPRQQGLGRRRLRDSLAKIALGAALFQVGLYFAAGFAVGFGQNANAFTPTLLAANSLFVTATLLGTELSRAWLLSRSRRGRGFFRMVFIAFSYTLLSLSPARLPPLQDGLRPVLFFLGTVFIPLFMEHFFASFLSLWGGAFPALTYRGVITAFSWFSPILPNTDWTFNALIGTAVPAVGLAVAGEATAAIPRRTRGKTNLRGWAILSAAVTAVTWFILGLFPARPVVIFGSSMVPALSVGDVAVVVKVDPGSLREGNIIAYQAERGLVVHRISSIYREGGRVFFVTKGDATGHPDDKPVEPHQVAGRVVCVVRKVGWGAIYLKALRNSFGRNSLP